VLQCVAVYASMHAVSAPHADSMQCVHTAFSSVLHCVAQRVKVCYSVLQCVAVCCSVLQCAAVCCSVLQCVAVCCSVL